MQPTNVHTIVMRRVRIIHALRTLTGSIGISFLVLIASLYVLGREVWVARVFQNMPHTLNLAAVSRFYISALATTSSIVQLLLLLIFITFLYMLRSTGRIISLRTMRIV